MKLKNLAFLSLLLCFSLETFSQNEMTLVEKTPFTIGEVLKFHSKILDEDRVLNVYLPSYYDPDSLQKYPVIYLLDGSLDEDFIHIAGLVQFGSFSWINMLPETIVVGIANVDRKRDFTYPTRNKKDKEDFPTTGGSAKFIDFIEREVQPLINQTYKTNSTSTVIGQSLGGLLATEILFKKPDLFDNYFIISPSLWWDDEALLKYEPKMIDGSKAIYIGVGKEGEVMERVASELHTKIKSILASKNNLHFQFFEKQDHGDVLHLAIYDAFEKVFKKEEK